MALSIESPHGIVELGGCDVQDGEADRWMALPATTIVHSLVFQSKAYNLHVMKQKILGIELDSYKKVTM